ncbi:helix-turn-helix domain-containing protein [Paenibacillus silviterrae]|uniref:helix-turn-helix domain-containing protein n=1 Tax=Paenibacillus silviterrae TaxID=3242194 RepID=UPI0025432358|nr:helix-turn-helix domain-containing protein [Paenibacillus chinjuensis]
MWKSKYLQRLILFSMILVTVPVVSLGLLSYFKARGIIESKVIQGQMQLLLQTQLKVEQLLGTIDNSMIQFINSPLVTQNIYTPMGPKDFQKIRDLTEGLHKLQSYDAGILNIQLASLEGKWLLDNHAYLESMPEEMNAVFRKLAQMKETSLWLTDEPTHTVQLIKLLPLNTVLHPAGILRAMVPKARLQQLVPDMTSEAETVILDENYRLLTDEVQSPTFSENILNQTIARLKTMEPESGFATLDVDHRSIGMTYRKSSFNGWIYLSLVSIEEITKESRAIGWYTLLISTTVFLLLVAFSLLISRKMYLPIRQVFDAVVGSLEKEQPPPKDELQAIGEHIRSMKLSQRKLLDQIQGQTGQLKEFFVRKLLLGELSAKEVQEKLTQYQYDPEPGWYSVLTIQIDTFEGTRFREADRDLLMFAVNNIVSELLPSGARLEPVVIGGNQVTLVKHVTTTPEAAKNEVYFLAENIQSTVKNILELKISIGISRGFASLTNAAQAYRDSLEALKYRIRFGEEAILHMEDVLPDSRVQTIYPEWIQKQLIDALLIPDLEKARQLLSEFLTVTLRENIHHQEYQIILLRLLSDMIRELQNTGEVLPAMLDGDGELFQQLIDLKTVQETEQWFMKTVMEPMVSVMSRKWEARNHNISEQMMDIIHHEFESDLTLNVCAERLNYHPNYLKTVFRKETGINFSDYLSQYRLNQAKKWLLETDMKISEIAERLRYQNSQNFIRYFRKMEDMTPGDYRKKYRMS